MALDFRDFEQGMRESLSAAYQRGACDMKDAYDTVLGTCDYDVTEALGFRRNGREDLEDIMADMAAYDVMEMKEKVDRWKEEHKKRFKFGDVVKNTSNGEVGVVTFISPAEYDVICVDGEIAYWEIDEPLEYLGNVEGMANSMLSGINWFANRADAEEVDADD